MNDRYRKSKQLFEEAEKIIPGGVNSARHPRKFIPGKYPIYMERGKGCHVWDVDGNEYIDWVMSFGPIILGHANHRVDEAVRKNMEQGFCFTMSHPVQNELAKELIKIIPCAEMVKFLTGGSDATSAAVRIARVYTGKEKIIRWGYHGWHDWCYGGAGTDRKAIGVPEGVIKDVLSFTYNDLDSLEKVLKENKGKVACVIMQPYEVKEGLPKEGFLEGVRELTHKFGAVLIYDEIRTGFRMALGGAQEYFGVIPDLTAISKAMANGYPISAVVGKREIMQVASKTRLSATFFVNSFPMVAALATIRELKEKDGIQYMWTMGRSLVEGLSNIFHEESVEAEVIGVPPLPLIKFIDKDKRVREGLKTAFFSETTKRGILFHPNHNWFLSLAHTQEDVDKTLEVCKKSLKIAKRKGLGLNI